MARVLAVLLVVVLLPVLYVLSLGPAVLLVDTTNSDELMAAFVVVYYPLLWLHANTWLRKPLDAYVDLWVD